MKTLICIIIAFSTPFISFANSQLAQPEFFSYYRYEFNDNQGRSNEDIISRVWSLDGSYVETKINGWFSTENLNAARYTTKSGSCFVIEVMDRISLQTTFSFDIRKISPDLKKCDPRFRLQAISNSGKFIAVSEYNSDSSDKATYLINSKGEITLLKVELLLGMKSRVNTPQVYFSRNDEKVILVESSRERALVVNLINGKQFYLESPGVASPSFGDFDDLTFPLWWSHDNKFVAARNQWSFFIWNAETGKIVFKERLGNGTLYYTRNTKFDTKGNFITVGYGDQIYYLNFAGSSNPEPILLGRPSVCKYSAFDVYKNEDNSLIALCGGAWGIDEINLMSGETLRHIDVAEGNPPFDRILYFGNSSLLIVMNGSYAPNGLGFHVFDTNEGTSKYLVPNWMQINNQNQKLIWDDFTPGF